MDVAALPAYTRRSGPVRDWVAQGIAAFGIGAFIGWWRSFSLLDPFFLVAFLSSSIILIGPIVAQRYRHDLDVGHLIRHSVLRACSTTTFALIVSLVWINAQWPGELLLPPWGVLAGALSLGLAATALAGILTILSLRRFTRRTVVLAFRSSILSAVLMYQYFPPAWSMAMTELLLKHGVAIVTLGLALAVGVLEVALWLFISERAA